MCKQDNNIVGNNNIHGEIYLTFKKCNDKLLSENYRCTGQN